MNTVQRIYCVRDTKAEHMLPPFCSANDLTAQRQFAEAVNTQGHEFGIHPADYWLYYLGTFNSASGEILSELPKVVAQADQLLDQVEPLSRIQGGE